MKFSLTYPKFRSPGFFWLWPVCLFGGFKWPFQGLLCWWPAFGWWKGLLENADKFFFRISQLLADGFLSQPLTHRQKLIEREVRLEDIFLCQSSGEGSYGHGVPVSPSGGLKKPTASFRDPALTPKKKSKILRNGEGITKFQTPKEFSVTKVLVVPKNRGFKTTTNERRTWWVGWIGWQT